MTVRHIDGTAPTRYGCPMNIFIGRWMLGVLSAMLGLGLLSLPASGQSQFGPTVQERLERRNRSYDLAIDGMQFRIPGSYMQPSNDPRSPSKYLHFSFWVSDGKPVQFGVPEIGSKDRVGRAIFWAPEPGRPYNSSDDFVVLVLRALPGTEESFSRRQDGIRQRIAGLHGTASTEDGLECRLYKSGAKDCATALGHDPAITMDILSVMPNNPTWRMTFHSPADSLWVELRFPELGQSRWPEVVCRTLLLIRSWRTSDAPSSPDCSKLPTPS